MLSQLSYSPKLIRKNFLMTRGRMITASRQMVGLDRIELSTPRLSSACSNQLSYRPADSEHRRSDLDRCTALSGSAVRQLTLSRWDQTASTCIAGVAREDPGFSIGVE